MSLNPEPEQQGQEPESGPAIASQWDFLRRALAEEKEPFLSKAEVRLALQRSGNYARPAAEQSDVSPQAFINAMKLYGYPTEKVGRPSVTDDWDAIQVMWDSGASAEEIQERFGVEPGTTRQHARREGWKKHQPGARRKGL